jgi:hypothetical protein
MRYIPGGKLGCSGKELALRDIAMYGSPEKLLGKTADREVSRWTR